MLLLWIGFQQTRKTVAYMIALRFDSGFAESHKAYDFDHVRERRS